MDINELHDVWFDVVKLYSPLNMTKVSDKLVALSGVAQIIASRSAHRYLAGLWEQAPHHQTFIHGLLWYVTIGHQLRPVEFRAPPWSWAAVEGVIANGEKGYSNSVPYGGCAAMVRFISASMWPNNKGKPQTGHLAGTYLRMKGFAKSSPPFESSSTEFITRKRMLCLERVLPALDVSMH